MKEKSLSKNQKLGFSSTGFLACVDCLAGAEARPTNLFMLYGWAKDP
jgi:hypothetical protein